MSTPTIAEVKANLIINSAADDLFIGTLVSAAISYAEAYQHLPDGYYTTAGEGGEAPEMPARTKQAVIMLASHWYESRDGGTGGFFADSANASAQSMIAVDTLLRLDRDWKV